MAFDKSAKGKRRRGRKNGDGEPEAGDREKGERETGDGEPEAGEDKGMNAYRRLCAGVESNRV